MSQLPDLSQIDLNLLYTFRTVLDAGGVGAAARKLRRSQPAISGRLRRLEHQLGVQLFERVGRGIQLTPMGRAIEREAQQLSDYVQGLVDTLHTASSEPVGTLRVGALPTVSVCILAPPIAKFQRNYPKAEIEIEHGLTGHQLAQLKRGELDVVASVGPPPQDGFDIIEVGAAVPTCIMPSRHRLRAKKRITVTDLLTCPYVGFSKVGDLFFDRVWAFLEEHGLNNRIRVRVPHIQTIQSLIVAGAGISILPAYTLNTPGLIGRPLADATFSHPIWLAVRRTTRAVPLVQNFLDEVKAEIPTIHQNS